MSSPSRSPSAVRPAANTVLTTNPDRNTRRSNRASYWARTPPSRVSTAARMAIALYLTYVRGTWKLTSSPSASPANSPRMGITMSLPPGLNRRGELVHKRAGICRQPHVALGGHRHRKLERAQLVEDPAARDGGGQEHVWIADRLDPVRRREPARVAQDRRADAGDAGRADHPLAVDGDGLGPRGEQRRDDRMHVGIMNEHQVGILPRLERPRAVRDHHEHARSVHRRQPREGAQLREIGGERRRRFAPRRRLLLLVRDFLTQLREPAAKRRLARLDLPVPVGDLAEPPGGNLQIRLDRPLRPDLDPEDEPHDDGHRRQRKLPGLRREHGPRARRSDLTRLHACGLPRGRRATRGALPTEAC